MVKIIRLEQVIAFGTIYLVAGLTLKWFTTKLPELSLVIWILTFVVGLINCLVFYYHLKDLEVKQEAMQSEARHSSQA